MRSRRTVPYLRAAADREPLPRGWETYPGGTVAGTTVEIAYHPRRHDVCRALNAMPASMNEDFVESGWSRIGACDSGAEIWARSRARATRRSLAQVAIAVPGTLGISR